MNAHSEGADSRPGAIADSRGAEQAQTKASLIGFYLSCAGVALGTAFAGGGYLWFEKTWALVLGIVVTVASTITCYTSLSKMRR